MTPALLSAIKIRLEAADDLLDDLVCIVADQDDADTLDDIRADLPALVAEVERLAPLADNWATCLDVTREVHGTHGCIFCGYNGEGYWQRGTHDARCPWVNVGGEEDRAREFWATVRATWKRMIAADDRVSAVVADRDAADALSLHGEAVAAITERDAAKSERRGLLGLVRAELDGEERSPMRLLDLAKQRMAERDAALALLREVEWEDEDSCMFCGGLFDEKTTRYRDDGVIEEYCGHAPDCRLAALIGGTK